MLSVIETPTAFSDAINLVRSLKRAAPELCPDCKQKIRDSLFDEKTGRSEPYQNQPVIIADGESNYDKYKKRESIK
jgi:hypothetical protein